jgi:nucleoside-diphosphate-sugar epimerase
MRVLVTGGLGFIGCHLIEHLRAAEPEAEIFVYDAQLVYDEQAEPATAARREREGRVRQVADVFIGDLLDAGELERVVRLLQPTRVVHLAAVPIAALARQRPAWVTEVNVGGTLNLLRALSDLRPVLDRLVFFSSSYVYGDFSTEAVGEDAPCSPIDLYGATKLTGEYLVRGFAEHEGAEAVVIRPSAVYGPYDTNQRVIQRFVESAIAGKPLHLHRQASPLDFTYVDDIAAGAVLALTAPAAANLVLNVTAGEARGLDEVVELLRGWFPDLETRYTEGRPHTPRRGRLDITQATTVLGYGRQYSLEDGLRRYLEHYAVPGGPEPSTSSVGA